MASADEYAKWIVDNQAKQGTPEFDIVAKAYQEAKGDKPAVVSVGESLRQIPRQLGLTARHAIEGTGELVNIGSEPIRAMVNPLLEAAGLPKGASAADLAKRGADALGLPKPANATERVVGDASRMLASGAGLGATSGKVAQVASSDVVRNVASSLAANQGTQAASAVSAGGAGGAVREAGGGPLEQFGASMLGGLGGAFATGAATRAYDGIASAVKNLLTPKQPMTEINVVLNQILAQNGIDVSAVPAAMRSELARDVKKALDTGGQVNQDVVRRLADYAAVGATPTKGTVTLDPVQITQERNLAKAGANSQDPRLQQLAQVQNQNNAKLIEGLNTLGGNKNADSRVVGQRVIDAVTGRDAAAKGVEKGLYDKARDSAGRQIDLDREGFVFDAYNRLGESNKSAFLPDNIKSLLEQIRAGKIKLLDGTERDTPFNVDVIDNLKTTLSTASRASADGNVRAAIKNVRDALENVQPRAVGRQVGGSQVVDPAALGAAQTQADDLSAASMGAFDSARRFARARRTWQESAPGISAALDDANPDRFVQDFILSGSNKAGVGDVEKLMSAVKKDPAAVQAVKENVVSYLKNKALSGAADEVGNFSPSGYNKALNELGDKLRLFFNKDEIAQLKAVGRVASYETAQPRGSAVNNSNTAGALAGLLDRIASSSLLGRVPFGDAAIRQPAQNWSMQIGAKNALDAGGAIPVREVSPEMLRLEQLVGPGLLLAAPRSNSRDDEKRR